MQRLLITGAAGFLGRRLVRAARNNYMIAAHARTNKIGLQADRIIAADLTEPDAARRIFDAAEPGAIIHAAAMASPNFCEDEPEKSLAVNVESAAILANLAQESKIPFVFISTDLVFDGTEPPYSEADSPSPVSVYGSHKAMAEEAVLSFNPDAAVARMPLMFGALPGSTSFLEPMLEAMSAGREIPLFVDEFRTPISGKTAAEGILMLLESGYGGLLHLGGRERSSRLEIGRKAAQAAGIENPRIREVRQRDVPMPAPRPADVSLDSSRAFAMGFDPGSLNGELARALEKA